MKVSLTGGLGTEGPDLYVLEQTELACGLRVDPSLLSVSADGDTLAIFTNPTGCSMLLEGGSLIEDAVPATLVCPPVAHAGNPPKAAHESLMMRQVQSKSTMWRRRKLAEGIGSLGVLTPSQRERLLIFLQNHHSAFALEEHERGKTDLLEMDIDTGNAKPWKCSP